MLVAAEKSPIAPMNSSTGMPLSSWTFLNASSDVSRFGDADGAAACMYPGRPHAGERTARGFAVLVEGTVDATAARMEVPVPPVIKATPLSHAIVAPATTSLIRRRPICMLSPSSSASYRAADRDPPSARTRQHLRREPNPAAAGADAEPEHERDDGDHLQPHRPHLPLAGERDSPPHREREDHREQQRRHLHPERRAVVALDRFGREQAEAGDDHHDQAADEPWECIARHALDRLIAKAQAEQPEI